MSVARFDSVITDTQSPFSVQRHTPISAYHQTHPNPRLPVMRCSVQTSRSHSPVPHTPTESLSGW